MLFNLVFLCCSAALVTQAKEPAVVEVQPGGNATLPCGIPVNTEVSWFSQQSDHIPARVMDLKYTSAHQIIPVYIRDEYRGRLVPVSDSNTHSLQLKNITEADLLMYCCIQTSNTKFGKCTHVKFKGQPGGQSIPHPLQSTPHPLQCTTPQPKTQNPDHLHCFILICYILLLCLVFLACYVYNKVLLRKSSDSQQRGSRTSRHDQVLSLTGLSVAFRPQREKLDEVPYVPVEIKSPTKRDQKREDAQDTCGGPAIIHSGAEFVINPNLLKNQKLSKIEKNIQQKKILGSIK
ncbi:uncharacterized protein LOC125739987 isoform X1 [Brienomyrus brachyistius]|uniref:uncharacterized protein LOC125739987 isoform X1 n=1 Tax=Brienomyrus brachyistius TaxID=42636 RepID=UPI0020B3F162|nr:uncharacterized protein LOC125739987 isoform X1 [Brienomyrus brachyistius]